MNIQEELNNGFLIFDGGTGSVLQEMGLQAGQRPEEWNLLYPEKVVALHTSYLRAGANIIKSNTFGTNSLRFGQDTEMMVTAAMQNARAAIAATDDLPQRRFVALDIGPCGKLLKPLGDLDFEDAVSIFAQVVNFGKQYADLILVETMNDAYETKAAVLAAKENCDLPIVVTNVYDESHKLMTGADPKAMVALLESLGVDALGMNCSLGPVQMAEILPELLEYASVPVAVNPNAGLPHTENDKTVFDISPEQFAEIMRTMAQQGAQLLGGCCGTTPEYIRRLAAALKECTPVPCAVKPHTLVSSYTHAVEIGNPPTVIGERINPTGKKRLKEALRCADTDYILSLAVQQEQDGAAILDVNVGLPELDEPAVLTDVVQKLQEVTALPLQLDSSDPLALARAMRIYNGKPLVNSVSGKQESMDAIFPLVKQYGGAVIALTLDEHGIPDTADGRVKIAEKILTTAKSYGISRKDLIFDPLAMAVSADPAAAKVTLESVRRISRDLGCRTSLGVSNVSFGLPRRENVTAAFTAMALQQGLDAAILNPGAQPVVAAFSASAALCEKDAQFASYISFADQTVDRAVTQADDLQPNLGKAIEKGMKTSAAKAAKQLLTDVAPMDVIDRYIIPALDRVGRGFEQKTVYLPQLLMSAEAASAAFEVIRVQLQNDGMTPSDEKKIILATVLGDIHDIGKNIVKVLLENYGYHVIDLGRDVPPERIVSCAIDQHVSLVGLSALMTTTVPAMEETIRCLHASKPDCKVVVGGAVLTQSYADMIGADHYSKDAMDTVRYAESLFT